MIHDLLLLLNAWSLYLRVLSSVRRTRIGLLNFTIFIISSITSRFCKIPPLDKLQVPLGLRVYTGFREIFRVLMRLGLIDLLDLILLANDLLLLVTVPNGLLMHHIRILIIRI